MTTTNIYILSLESDKFYVGKSAHVMERYQQHIDGEGSSWTRKYKPTAIIKVIEDASPFDEDRITKEWMAKYGIDNVRGGSYSSERLSQMHRDTLQREIWAAQDCCLLCGKKGHFANECRIAKKRYD
jgi:predicted GIY-YIG superfamily endonuclease